MTKKPDWSGPGDTEMIRLRSTAITAAGYDPKLRKMYIRFPSGEVYDFCGVPRSVFDDLIKAPSAGTYYYQYVRGRYPCH